MADGTFSPLAARKRRQLGPGSNTGQKSLACLSAPIIDFCTVVIKGEQAKRVLRKMPWTEVVRYVFGVGRSIAVGPMRDVSWNFYPQSAVMVDETSSVVGKIGTNALGDICISLTGQGCQYVPSWPMVADVLDELQARISRVDVAVDDLNGQTFNIDTFMQMYERGEFVSNGRPPTASFHDDLGSGKGCSLYIGQKGHKQLNVYEKGKQLGDLDSGHTRCELRLYAKRLDLETDVLRTPGKYFAGAYPALVAYVVGDLERLNVKGQMVNASAKAMVKNVRQQAGTALRLLMDALGDEAMEFIITKIARPGRPGRFKGYSGDLPAHVRAELSIPIESPSL